MRRIVHIWLIAFLLLFGAALSIFFLLQSNQMDGIADAKPRLAVLIVFDQMRGDYLAKWQEHFDKDGLGRLLTDGAWFRNCHYPYALTVTGAGHTSMVTGCSPDKHGIIANTPFDPLSKNQGGWYWYAEDIRVPTLWDAAARAGLATASVDWPVTVGANINYNIAQYWRAGMPGPE